VWDRPEEGMTQISESMAGLNFNQSKRPPEKFRRSLFLAKFKRKYKDLYTHLFLFTIVYSE